ncbi:MAG: DUF2335 domain-containing protein [Pseudomonadota bacterium]
MGNGKSKKSKGTRVGERNSIPPPVTAHQKTDIGQMQNESSDASELVVERPLNTRIVATAFQGPYPPPHLLAEYDRICPGFSKDMLSMAQQDAAHIRELERKSLYYKQREVLLGQVFGFLIAVIVVISAAMLIYSGHEATGVIFSGTCLVTLVSLFIYGRSKSKNLSKKSS